MGEAKSDGGGRKCKAAVEQEEINYLGLYGLYVELLLLLLLVKKLK